MQKRWLFGMALVLVTATPSCTKRDSRVENKRRVTPPMPATIEPATPPPVVETPPIVEAPAPVEEAPKVVVTPPRKSPPTRIAQAPKAEIQEQVYIIDEPSNTSATESQIVEPIPAEGGSLELETEASPTPRTKGTIVIGNTLNVERTEFLETQLGVGVTFPLSPGSRVGIVQSLRKLFAPGNNIGGRENILFEDTQVTFEQLVSKQSPLAEIKLNAGATLPVSRRSNLSKTITRLSVGATAKGFLTDSILVSATPEFQYFVNQDQVNLSGQPLNRFVVGQSVSMDWMFSPQFHWVTWGRGYYRFYETADASKNRVLGPSTTFGLGTHLQFDFPTLSVQAGFLRGTSLFSDISTTDIFYDSAPASQVFIALTAAF